MSALIESTARGIKNLIPGASFDQQSRVAQTARGRDLIKQLTLGGLAMGGTAGAAVVLSNYLKSLGQEAELFDESRLNDDTLYVPMPEKKAADDSGPRWSAPGLGLTAGVVSAGGAYALTQALYNMIQKRRHLRLLDEAQQEALTAADQELSKGAALGMTMPELLASFPVAIPLLAALASGGVTYTALNKAFPTVGKPKSKYPKRIRAVAADGAVSDVDAEDESNTDKVTKSAADRACEDDYELAGLEFMTLLTANLAQVKQASVCITADLINAAANQGVSPLVAVYEQGGLLALSDSVKNASAAEEPAKVAAVVALHRHPQLSPVVAALAAAEFQDLVPTIMAKCASMDPVALDKTAGIAALMQMAFIRPQMAKTAAIPQELLLELSQMLAGEVPADAAAAINSPQGGAEEVRDEVLTSDSSGSMAEENDGGASNKDGMDDEAQGQNDAVDEFFERPDVAPRPRA